MAIYFSPALCAFYSDALHGQNRPGDALAITAARHRALLAGQATGSRIVAGDDGLPRLQKPAKQTTAIQRARVIAAVKREAARRIDLVAPVWRQVNDLRAPSAAAAARFAAIDALRAASAAIEAAAASASVAALGEFAVADHPLWPKD